MQIIQATKKHVGSWAELRAELWPDETVQAHHDALSSLYASGNENAAAFLALDGSARLIGFAEAGLRHDFVNGCDSSPVLFLEGIYVLREARRSGVARSLCGAVTVWGKTQGCSEFASDALLDNVESHAFHKALGFAETERVVYFRKDL